MTTVSGLLTDNGVRTFIYNGVRTFNTIPVVPFSVGA
jgi:hypothetical protein